MTDHAAPLPEDVENIARRIAAIQSRIDAACARVARDPAEVRLLPVSKTVEVPRLRAAHAAGCRWLGENKVQEAKRKWEAMGDLPGLRFSVIGHLQTNKARDVARFASEFQALDSQRVAEALDRHLQAEGRALDVFVQVNTSAEPSKYGLKPEDTVSFVRGLAACSSLRVRGLMTLALFSDDQMAVRACFQRLRQLRDELVQHVDAPALSMGMSGDFEMAIEEGANVVRVGTAIFGTRPTPDSHYWPGEPG